jgi:hypothetical protein
MLIIGIGNKARSGKDTAGEAIVAHFEREAFRLKRNYSLRSIGPTVKLYKFADALYAECRELHGMTEKDAPLLQRVGMDRRLEDSNYWVKQVESRVNADKPDIAVITDMRFLNEAEFVKANGGITINVSRLNAYGGLYVSDDRPSYHPSETQLDGYNWDYKLVAKTGEAPLIEQLAVVIVEFERTRRP